MAALTQRTRVVARAASAGEGPAIAALWRELWDAHESWGGYPGSQDPRVYLQLAHRLDDEARVRAGYPVLGRHVHLVADYGGVPCGQVEGWFERHGVDEATPFTCEVRSLVVGAGSRRRGAGRALLRALASAAQGLARHDSCVMAAEVLDPNPARAFYDRVGYGPIAWNACVDADVGARVRAGPFVARVAGVADALPIAHLELVLAARRRASGDIRFDRPRALDSSTVAAIGAQIASTPDWREPATLVVEDCAGAVRGVASFSVHPLEPPFLPLRRALVGRFGLDPSLPAAPLVASLLSLGCRFALSQGAAKVEVTDLSAPGTELHDAALAAGAAPWSRVVAKAI